MEYRVRKDEQWRELRLAEVWGMAQAWFSDYERGVAHGGIVALSDHKGTLMVHSHCDIPSQMRVALTRAWEYQNECSIEFERP